MVKNSTNYKLVPLFKQIKLSREMVKAFDDGALASVNCTPAMFGLMECMAKNENNPLSCLDLKRTLASCVATAARAKQQKSTLYSDINRFIFAMERRDGKK